MAGELPILMTADDARKLRRVINRSFRGEGGIAVHQTDSAVTITDKRAEHYKPTGGSGAAFEMMRVVGYGPNNYTLSCKRIDGNGAVTGAALSVRCFVYNDAAPGAWPNWQAVDLTQCMPPLVPHATNGSIVPVEASGPDLWCRFPFTFYGCTR